MTTLHLPFDINFQGAKRIQLSLIPTNQANITAIVTSLKASGIDCAELSLGGSKQRYIFVSTAINKTMNDKQALVLSTIIAEHALDVKISFKR